MELPIWSYQVEGNVWGGWSEVVTLAVLTEAVFRAHKPWHGPSSLEGLEYSIDEELFGPDGICELEDPRAEHYRMRLHIASSITEAKGCFRLGLNYYPDGVYYVSFIFQLWRGKNTVAGLEILLRRDIPWQNRYLQHGQFPDV